MKILDIWLNWNNYPIMNNLNEDFKLGILFVCSTTGFHTFAISFLSTHLKGG